MYKFKFADIGEGLHEGLVGEIYVKDGDKVSEGDSLFGVETDKVSSDIPSPVDGVIKKILIKTGETVHVGDITMHIDDGKGDQKEPQEEKIEKVSKPDEEEGGSVVGDIKSSNEVFSFDMFGSQKKPEVASPKEKAPSIKEDEVILPDVKAATASGNGEKVDIVVIGAGPGGYEVASRLAHQGNKVVVIEDRFAGGVCLNIGCIPTKALLKGAKVLYSIKKSQKLGIKVDHKSIKINWQEMQDRKNSISQTLSKGVEGRIKFSKAEFIKGKAEIVDKNNVKVGDRVFTTKYIIVASGSQPIKLEKLPGFQAAYDSGFAITSKEALSLESVPKKLAVVGGGVIGIEFATLFNRLGTEVTIFEGTENLLTPMDFEVRDFVKQLLIDKGIKIKTNVKVNALDEGHVLFEEEGKTQKGKFDKVLVAVGRKANNLGLDEKIGIKLGKRGEILVNDIMQTNIPNIFAIGDVVGHNMLAHVAYKHASVLQAAFKGECRPYNRDIVPGVVYIYPEISVIGKTEQQLKEENIPYITSKWKNLAVGRDLAEDDTNGFTKLLVDPKYGMILGAHIINASSSEMITGIAGLMELEGTVFELAWTTHPHPSASEGIWEAATASVEKLEKARARNK